MKVFLDTNVLLDFEMERDGIEEASEIFQMGEDGKLDLCVSILTMANTAYIARKGRTKEKLCEDLSLLSGMISVLPMDGKQWLDALALNAGDLEDALQYECAKASNCDCIVTRNTRDFSFSAIEVLTPKDFLGTVH